MTRCVQEPVTTAGPRGLEGTQTAHPAFGMIGANRVNGATPLFGSDFVHSGYVSIHIRRAVMNRSLSSDWPFAREELIEVSLSEAQWATFVCSMNIGQGIPCTIEHVQGDRMPGLPDPVPRAQTFASEMNGTLAAARESAAAMRAAIGESGLSAKRQKELLDHLHMLDMRIGSSVDFVAERFGEHMGDVTETAKMEVNAYAMRALHGLAVPIALPGNQTPKLEGGIE